VLPGSGPELGKGLGEPVGVDDTIGDALGEGLLDAAIDPDGLTVDSEAVSDPDAQAASPRRTARSEA
jgi:hypothetical protein